MTKKQSKKKNLPKLDSHQVSFLVIIFLMVALSSYAFFVFIDSAGKYISLMHASVVQVDGAYTIRKPVIPPRENPFVDIDVTQDYAKAVLELYHLGFINGYNDGTFGPDKTINRAEFSQILVEASDLDYTSFDPSSLANCFYDVRELSEHWYSPPICALKFEGAINGYSDGNFMPGRKINRVEAYKIVLDVFDFHVANNDEVIEIPYSDVSADDWYLAVADAVKIYGLNLGSNLLKPNDEVTRAELAVLIYTAMDRKDLL